MSILKSRLTLWRENQQLRIEKGKLLDLTMKITSDYENIKAKYNNAVECNKTPVAGPKQDSCTYGARNAVDDE